MNPPIVVSGLRVRYPGARRLAIDDISFTVDEGEIFGFLGPNGAGKSTTQRVLTRLLRGFEGHAEVLGRPLRAWGPEYFEHIGVGFELPAHFSRLTARQNLEAFGSLYSVPVEPAGALLAAVGLEDAADQVVAGFSKGMKMRLNLARALVNRPRVLFLDEPTSGLDPVHTTIVKALIRDQAARGGSVFLTTHDMVAAEQLCDRVAFMVEGRLAATDTPRGFRLRHGAPTVRVEYREADGLVAREFPLAQLGADADFLDLLRRGQVETMHTREASLDEVFVAVTGGRL
jgi:fluoroquinolone transport system ATP-binding protein